MLLGVELEVLDGVLLDVLDADGVLDGVDDDVLLGVDEGVLEGVDDAPLTNSSAPTSHVPERVSPSISSVKFNGALSPLVSVPTSIRSDPETRWKSSKPAVTFTKLLVFTDIFCKPVDPLVSELAQVVFVLIPL